MQRTIIIESQTRTIAVRQDILLPLEQPADLLCHLLVRERKSYRWALAALTATTLGWLNNIFHSCAIKLIKPE